MKLIKKLIIMFALLLCLFPSNYLKADDGIMPTEAACICTKCGNTFVNTHRVYTTDWYLYEADYCTHYTNGLDVGYAREYYIKGSCTNCGNQLYVPNCIEYKGVCEGYN